MLHLLAGHSRSLGQQLRKHGYRRLIAWPVAPEDSIGACRTKWWWCKNVCCRMLDEILASRFMIKKSMKDYKDNPVCILFTRLLIGCFHNKIHVQMNTESVQCFSIKYHNNESLYGSTFKLYLNHEGLGPKCHLTFTYIIKKTKNVILYPVRNCW